MMWQRARVTKESPNDGYPGRALWVTQRPFRCGSYERAILTNRIDWRGRHSLPEGAEGTRAMCFNADHLELLPIFCDHGEHCNHGDEPHAEPIPFEDWLKKQSR